MSRIDIAYGVEHRVKQACQTAYKSFLAGQILLVFCTDEKRLNFFSKMLWSVEATAFVPHPYAEEEGLPAQIYLCNSLDEQSAAKWYDKKTWLLNLDILCPPFIEYFDRVLEIISTHPEDRRLARERVVEYKKAGHQIFYHDLSAK